MYYLSQISAFSPAFTVSHIWKFLQPPEKTSNILPTLVWLVNMGQVVAAGLK